MIFLKRKVLFLILVILISSVRCSDDYKIVFSDQVSEIYLPKKLLLLSNTMKNMIEDAVQEGPVQEILLQDIDVEIGEKIISLLTLIDLNSLKEDVEIEKELFEKIKSYNLSEKKLINLIMAANFLDIPQILKVSLKYTKVRYWDNFKVFFDKAKDVLPDELLSQLVPYVIVAGNTDRRYLSVTVAPNGNLVAVGYDDKHIYILNGTGIEIHSNTKRKYASVTVAPNGNIIAIGRDDRHLLEDNYIYILDGAGTEIHSNTQREYLSVTVAPNGNIIAIGRDDRHIYILDETGTEIHSNTQRKYMSVAVAPNGNIVAKGSYDKHIYILDETGTEIHSNTQRRYMSVAVAPNGNIVAKGLDNIYILDGTGREIGSNTQRRYMSVAVAPNGNIVAIGDGRIYILDEMGREIGSNTQKIYLGVAVAPNGNIVAVDNEFHVYILSQDIQAYNDLLNPSQRPKKLKT